MEDKNLVELHEEIGKILLTRIKNGEATPADISNAIKFLKDNGINCDGMKNTVISDIITDLPSIEELEGMIK